MLKIDLVYPEFSLLKCLLKRKKNKLTPAEHDSPRGMHAARAKETKKQTGWRARKCIHFAALTVTHIADLALALNFY